MLNTDPFYGLSSPNLFMFEGVYFFGGTIMNDVPSQTELVPWRYVEKKSSRLRNFLSVIASRRRNAKCLNISAWKY
jgi:hypothetical protein